MYYSEHARVKRIERLLEKLAYISVALDFVIALASFMVIRRVSISEIMLTISSDLIMIEMGVIVVLFVTLMAIKHYGGIVAALEQARFRSRHAKASTGFGVR